MVSLPHTQNKETKKQRIEQCLFYLECAAPLGIENWFIPDYAITASSQVRDLKTMACSFKNISICKHLFCCTHVYTIGVLIN